MGKSESEVDASIFKTVFKKYRKAKVDKDFSDVFDFSDLSKNSKENQQLITEKKVHFRGKEITIYGFKDLPGFCFIHQALDVDEQLFFSQKCLKEYPNAPHLSNHTPFHET